MVSSSLTWVTRSRRLMKHMLALPPRRTWDLVAAIFFQSRRSSRREMLLLDTVSLSDLSPTLTCSTSHCTCIRLSALPLYSLASQETKRYAFQRSLSTTLCGASSLLVATPLLLLVSPSKFAPSSLLSIAQPRNCSLMMISCMAISLAESSRFLLRDRMLMPSLNSCPRKL